MKQASSSSIVQGGEARLFYVFHFASTALHGIHIIGGLVLVGWIVPRARRDCLRLCIKRVVGLYWSFRRRRVDRALCTDLCRRTRVMTAHFCNCW